MGVADARAIHPSLEVAELDADADLRLLESLADWCDRYTPLVALDGTDGLLLDITGCSHLFGGEDEMLRDMVSRLASHGFCGRAGIASTVGAAWASARFLPHSIIPCAEEDDFLPALPLPALRLEPAVCASLESLGLRTVGSILATPRAPLARRFGASVILRLDQAFGRVEEAISPRFPVPPLSVERQMAEPILFVDAIEAMVAILAASAVAELERRQEGARALQLALFRVDGVVKRISIETSRPLRDAKLICRLFHERLLAPDEEIDTGCGFELLRLSVLTADPLDICQADFDPGRNESDEDLAMFVDRVSARLGRQVLTRPDPIGSHIPERAIRMVPFANVLELEGPASPLPVPDRPIRLLAHAEPLHVQAVEVPEGPPQQFRWRQARYQVAEAEGPERIAPEWWLHPLPVIEKEHDGKKRTEKELDELMRQAMAEQTARLTRDYFRVEDFEGRRFLLYREGLYRPDAHPRWFMQGLFA